MRVVLTQNVENLGITGDEKEVKNGYARNWLLPNKFAVAKDDPSAKKVIEEARRKRENIAKELEKIKNLAEKINNSTLEISAKAGDKGKLFGAVTTDDIAKKLKIDKKAIESPSVKTIGEHEINIKFDYGIRAKVKLIVSKEKSR